MCQRGAPNGQLINQLWSIAYHVLLFKISRAGPERSQNHIQSNPIQSKTRPDPKPTQCDSIRFDTIRIQIRYGIVSCLTSVTCTLDIKWRLILIIFLKKKYSNQKKTWYGSPNAARQTSDLFMSSTHFRFNEYEYVICHFSSPLTWGVI